MKEFICLSCWETFEISSSDIRGKESVPCPHCGADQDVLDDVVGVNEGNLGESEKTAETKEPEANTDDSEVDVLLSSAGIDFDEVPDTEGATDENEEPGVELETSDPPQSQENLGTSSFDPLEEEEEQEEDSGIDLFVDNPEETPPEDPDDPGIDLLSEDLSEEVETFDLVAEDETLEDLLAQDTDPAPEENEEVEETPSVSTEDGDLEIGTEYSKENAAENAALAKSVQELVSSITERDLSEPTQDVDSESVDPLAGADTLDDLYIATDVLGDLENQFDHAGGLDFDLEGLEVDAVTDIDEEEQENDEEEQENDEEEQENDEEEQENDEDSEPVGFELVSGEPIDSDEETPSEPAPAIDEDELTDAVSDLIDASVDGGPAAEDYGKVKSWRVRLKSGLILSFPSLIVVQGWAADKDTSTIGLARGDGDFKPYEQVLGMMQTIETKAIDPDEINKEEKEDEIIDGLSAAARAAAQRRRDGKMENITAEYQFRKDVFKKQKSASPKKLFVVVGLLVVLAGAAVALEFLAIVDLGLGFAPAPPSAPPAPATPEKTGPKLKVSKTATPGAKSTKKTAAPDKAKTGKAKVDKKGVTKKKSATTKTAKEKGNNNKKDRKSKTRKK